MKNFHSNAYGWICVLFAVSKSFPSFRFVPQWTATMGGMRAWTRCILHFTVALFRPSPISFSGEMRVQLLNQTLLDLGLYDDGPYEVADQKQLNAQLIPVPYHSYLGRICPHCSLLPVHRREREGREGTTPWGYRLHPSQIKQDIVIEKPTAKKPPQKQKRC